jgi:predicted enzyme related to lactoylglutathione lyase
LNARHRPSTPVDEFFRLLDSYRRDTAPERTPDATTTRLPGIEYMSNTFVTLFRRQRLLTDAVMRLEDRGFRVVRLAAGEWTMEQEMHRAIAAALQFPDYGHSSPRLTVRLERPQTIPTRPTTSGVTMTGPSTQGIKTVLHPVSDLATAKEVYAALLGVPPQTDESYYVGFEAAGQHIGLVPGGGPQGMTSPVAYWHVPDLDAKLAEVTAAGATVKEPAHDVGGGRLVATVTDPDGNVLGLLQDR